MNKLPEITIAFWITKICATTLGETGGDLLAQTLDLGYVLSSVIFLSLFFVAFFIQISAKRYNPLIYWFVIITTSTAGTTISDLMDRTLALGYATGASILALLLVCVLSVWKLSEKSLSVTSVRSVKAERFYWAAILVSNTLGTALGDFLADNSGLGFSGGAMLIGSLLLLIVLAHYFTRISGVVLFWSAFVLTRPFGATFGDYLTKPIDKGGLDVGTTLSSALLFCVMAILVWREYKTVIGKEKTS
ncbi:hypothetical protein G6047_07675 [Flavobacterium sp. SE-s28]|uniref:Membrane-anchored protein n=1 Tax=Flavobacterium silvaticum TaxID=1852020 RepID=A0A972FTV7_9FLAO|nr:hypothetical protein [Flavobacterium silvaticum]